MSKTEGDQLGPGFEHRLRSELDRVHPRSTAPRYATAPPRVGGWRFAPVALVISVAGMVALAAFVTTGSTNPVVWTERVVTAIHSEPTAAPPATEEHHGEPAAAPKRESEQPSSAEPTERAEPSDRPRPGVSPEPMESPEPTELPRASGDH